MATYNYCPVCGSPAFETPQENWLEWECFRCGGFRTDAVSLIALEKLQIKGDRLKVPATCGWIREQKPAAVAEATRDKPRMR